MIESIIAEWISAWGIPTAITSFAFWLLKRDIEARDKKRDAAEAERDRKAEERDENRMKLEIELIKGNQAALALGEATARAVQRIPDAHCNGDMTNALEYATSIKRSQKDFLMELGLHSLHED